MRFLAASLLAAALCGCVGPSKSLNIQAVPQVGDLINVTATAPAGAEVLGTATGVSCKNKIWDPAASNDAALAQLKTQAIQRGAKGIAGVTYAKEGTTLSANCWEAIYATGILYR